MQSKYVRYGKLYRGSFYFVYDKYRHCIEMLLERRNMAYKESLYAIVYATYGYRCKRHLYATFRRISSKDRLARYVSGPFDSVAGGP